MGLIRAMYVYLNRERILGVCGKGNFDRDSEVWKIMGYRMHRKYFYEQVVI
jgi:hypothetical protein